MNHEHYMQRCIGLAMLGAGSVAPNPMVGAVLVHKDRIIGEGYHRQYGGPHAEVNCIGSVAAEDKKLISESVMYVSLEPCSHYGKTPPCADLIIRHKIPQVVIGSRDPFSEVNGKGIEQLKAAGTGVVSGVLEAACKELNRRFFTFHTQHRPYIILKWAETGDGFIASQSNERLLVSNAQSNRLVHKWRSEEAAILVGTHTAVMDNPSLTTRLWPGSTPVRMVVDMQLSLPASLHLFDQSHKTIVFNTVKHEEQENLLYYHVTEDVNLVHQMMNAAYLLKLQSILVEGGARLLQSFIDAGCWDEARVIKNEELIIKTGLPGPVLADAKETGRLRSGSDTIFLYKK